MYMTPTPTQYVYSQIHINILRIK